MAEKATSEVQRAGHFKDARGRKVTLLDPVTMRLLRRHDVIPAETVRALADEIGVGWSRRVRVVFLIAVVSLGFYLLVTIVGIMADTIKAGRFVGPPIPVLVVLPCILIGPFVIWMGARTARFKRIHRIMLEHRRCPHCGYDIRGLPTDPEDGTTVCPECGCAWLLDSVGLGEDASQD